MHSLVTRSKRHQAAVLALLLMGAALMCLPSVARAAAPPASFADLVAKVSPAVVNIRVEKTLKAPVRGMPFHRGSQPPGLGDPWEFFRRFFEGGPGGRPMPMPPLKQKAVGSGVIVDPAGYVLTNNHVVAGADKVTVHLKDGRTIPAEIKGLDPKTDLALLKLKKKGTYPALPLGDSDQLRVGDWVLAVGNPFGLENTVTAGIVSAKGRVIGAGPYDDFIQTDASINPGNSGGPLINLKGEVVGINTAIVAQAQGIGFAIPINLARKVMEQLKAHGRVVRGWLGIYIQPVTKELAGKFGLKKPHGALVADVVAGGPAEKAGIKRGDIITAFDGQAVKDSHELPRMVAHTKVGKEVKVRLLRQGKPLTVTVKIGELKQEASAGAGAPSGQPRWGLELQELTPDLAHSLGLESRRGVVITRVLPDSPAAQAGLRRGDVILEADHHQVKGIAELRSVLSKVKKGGSVLLLVRRGKNTLFVVMKSPA